MKASVISAAALLFAFLFIGGSVMILSSYTSHCIHSHGLFMQSGTIMTGIALSVFRLCRGASTAVVKYIHLALVALACVLFVLGYVEMIHIIKSDHVHAVAGFVTLGALAVEFLLGFFLFTYLYEYRWLRVHFSPIHNIVGIWLYACLVGCCMSGNHSINPMEVEYHFHEEVINAIYMTGFVIVVVLLVSPFFEWELMGHL